MNGTRANSAIWSLQGQEKSHRVRGLFESIAPTYDRLNSLISFRSDRRWRDAAVDLLDLHKGDSVLDVCCGTGDFVRSIRRRIGRTAPVIGLDFAVPMLDEARRKTEAEALYVSGDALSIPCASEAFDAVTVGWGIRNVSDIDLIHREIARVLKPGGRFVSVDMALPSKPLTRLCSRALYGTVLTVFGPISGNRAAYRYLHESTAHFWSRERLAESMRRAGFDQVGHMDRMFGNICIHWGRKP